MPRTNSNTKLRGCIVIVAIAVACVSFVSLGLSRTPKAFVVFPETNVSPINSPNGLPKTLGAGSDGPKVVFGSVRTAGDHDIYTMDLDGSNQTRLTNNPAYDDQPRWSPD